MVSLGETVLTTCHVDGQWLRYRQQTDLKKDENRGIRGTVPQLMETYRNLALFVKTVQHKNTSCSVICEVKVCSRLYTFIKSVLIMVIIE